MMKYLLASVLIAFPVRAYADDDENYRWAYKIAASSQEESPFYLAVGLEGDPRLTKPYTFVGTSVKSGYLGKNFPDGIYECYKSGDKILIRLFKGYDPYTDFRTKRK